jgi:hypothetical protein
MEPDHNPVSTPRKPRPWTFRVENIPANISPEQLLEQFNEQDRSCIEVRSLAPAVVSNDGELTALSLSQPETVIHGANHSFSIQTAR